MYKKKKETARAFFSAISLSILPYVKNNIKNEGRRKNLYNVLNISFASPSVSPYRSISFFNRIFISPRTARYPSSSIRFSISKDPFRGRTAHQISAMRDILILFPAKHSLYKLIPVAAICLAHQMLSPFFPENTYSIGREQSFCASQLQYSLHQVYWPQGRNPFLLLSPFQAIE